MKIVQADHKTLEQTAHLFDLYRQFYKQPSDVSAARAFISARMVNKDSIIFLAMSENDEGMGFTQLFPSFSSVAMKTVHTLNDLYVAEAHRRSGVARALMNTAKAFAEKNSAHAIKLATAKNNHQAKTLYDDIGYKLIDSYDYYSLSL